MTCRNGKKKVGLVSSVSWEQDYLTDEESYDTEDEEEGAEELEDEGDDGEVKRDVFSNQDNESNTEAGINDAR